MPMNEDALRSMGGMVKAMLPYEYDYEPTSLGTLCLSEIFEILETHVPNIKEYEGFLGHILKQIDIRNDSTLDEILVELRDIIVNSYPVDYRDEVPTES